MKYQTQNLLLTSLLLLMLSSCTFARYGDLVELENRSIKKEALRPPFDAGSFKKALFKAKVKLYGNYFSGLLFIKAMPDSSYRITFVTETGFKMFDFEFTGETTTVHYSIKEFDKKSVLKTIESDMKLLLMNDLIFDNVTVLTDAEKLHTIFKLRVGDDNNYYFIERANETLAKIENSSDWFMNTRVTLSDYRYGLPQNIKFLHYNFRLDFELRLLKEI